MGKDSHLRALEESVHEAFGAAEQYRAKAGMGPLRGPQYRTIKSGPNKGAEILMSQYQSGPQKGTWHPFGYRMTIWLQAWEYADLLRLREATGFTGSPATLLKKLIRDATPAKLQHARPLPRTPATPLSQRLKLRNGHGRARAA